MKKYTLPTLLAICIAISSIAKAQRTADSSKVELKETLSKFYDAAQKGSTEGIMDLFDADTNIMFVGGDSAEIWKGEDKIREHLNSMFPDEKVTLEMNRTDIDVYQNTAWIFADGTIKITLPKSDAIKAPYRFTAILIKKNNSWKFRLYMGTTVKGS